MMTLDEFTLRASDRHLEGKCVLCDEWHDTSYDVDWFLCEEHMKTFSDRTDREIQPNAVLWAYQHYKQELIKNSINIWSLT